MPLVHEVDILGMKKRQKLKIFINTSLESLGNPKMMSEKPLLRLSPPLGNFNSPHHSFLCHLEGTVAVSLHQSKT